MNIKLTVFFEDPFWIGVFERLDGESYEVSRIVFGSEPKDAEVYDFIIHNFYKLKFSKSLFWEDECDRKINPKRLQRQIKKQVSNNGISTKAQQAIKQEIESRKEERKVVSREERDSLKQRNFELRQEKKKQKKRGH